VKFFLDNCISKAMAVAIAAIGKSQGIEIVHLTEIFDAKTPDTVWIPGIKGMGFVVVSGDPRISRNPANRAAWLESGLTAFFLDHGWMDKKLWVQAAELIRWWPIIMDTAKECTPGSGFLLPFKGSVPRKIFPS
jgi:hypothetical protein